MLKFYYSGAPNPTKIALFLEEAGLAYEPIPVDTRKGDQHKPEYLAINPNAKVPAIVDGDATVFDSSAILLYLGEKTGKFMPAEDRQGARRAAVLDDVRRLRRRAVFGPVGAFPRLCAGEERIRDQPLRLRGAAPFRHHQRRGSASSKYMLGDTYTIVDMNVWGWARLIPNVLGEEAWDEFPNLKRLIDEISARPAAARAVALKDKHTVQDRDGRRGAATPCSRTSR